MGFKGFVRGQSGKPDMRERSRRLQKPLSSLNYIAAAACMHAGLCDQFHLYHRTTILEPGRPAICHHHDDNRDDADDDDDDGDDGDDDEEEDDDECSHGAEDRGAENTQSHRHLSFYNSRASGCCEDAAAARVVRIASPSTKKKA